MTHRMTHPMTIIEFERRQNNKILHHLYLFFPSCLFLLVEMIGDYCEVGK